MNRNVIIIVDMRKSFTSDIDVTALMSDDLPYEIKTLNSMENIDDVFSRTDGTVIKVVVAQNIMKNSNIVPKGNWPPIQCYLESEDGWELAKAYKFPCFGVVNTADELFEVLNQDPKAINQQKQTEEKRQKKTVQEQKNISQVKTPKNPEKKEKPVKAEKSQDFYASYENDEMDVFESDYDDFDIDDGLDGYQEESDYEPYEKETGNIGVKKESQPQKKEEEYGQPNHAEESETGNTQNSRPPKNTRKRPVEKKSEKHEKMKVYNDPEMEKQLMEDMGKKKPKTKVVTVYSAKGGVGKTTIAVELATYLSLVTRGRKRLRVCIVDYNIDFGDVSTTLAIPKKGSNLAYWADEIRGFLAQGKAPEDIEYSKEEIEEWLRVDEKTGLYILPAPVTNEDSSEIVGEELDIILYNLKKNGEFDFIICDTGNNTRNTTMSAIEFADMILMVVDQNINTASCDERFLNTMKVLNFDLSKTRLVVNRVMPSRMTTIPIQELLACFPYDCAGKLKYSTDVIKATNLGKPLALNDPDNEYVKQMSEIVAYLLDDDSFTEERPKKKSLLSKLFGKK